MQKNHIYIIVALLTNEKEEVLSRFNYVAFSNIETAKDFIKTQKSIDKASGQRKWTYYIDKMILDELKPY